MGENSFFEHERTELRRQDFRICFEHPVNISKNEEFWRHGVKHKRIELLASVFGRERDESISHEYPVDWWEHVKQRWFPRWALAKWPVKKTKVQLKALELYPGVFAPDREHTIYLEKLTMNEVR